MSDLVLWVVVVVVLLGGVLFLAVTWLLHGPRNTEQRMSSGNTRSSAGVGNTRGRNGR